MGETKKIEQIHCQLISKRDRVNQVKMTLVVIISIITIINLFALFYYYNELYIVLEISMLVLILILIVSSIYINIIKSNCKKLEYLIYQKQKL